jgi:hypothetical protein
MISGAAMNIILRLVYKTSGYRIEMDIVELLLQSLWSW